MNTTAMKTEIAEIEAAMPESGIKSCFGSSASGKDGYRAIRTRIAALRFCGMPESAAAFECNACGQEHAFSEATPVNWGGAACVVGADCVEEDMELLA